MDALSDVLRSVRLKGGIFLDARFTAPFCVTSHVVPEDCRPFFEAPARIISYHYVISGELLLGLPGEPLVPVHAGEIIMLSRGEPHTLGSGAGLKPVPARPLITMGEGGGLSRIVMGGTGAPTHIVCGFLGTDQVYNPILEALPGALKVDVRDCTTRDWIDASMRFAASELIAGRLESAGILSRLSELLFAEGVRQYLATLGADDTRWLRGLRDPQIGKALALIHRDMTAPWAAEDLAAEVAMSRSAFMERFGALVGMPPIRYQTLWRLHSAQQHLMAPGSTVAQVSHLVGYESEEAFSRAFKREFGVSPARWRDSAERPVRAAS